jgi:predicted DCC family thiol-disulfide oxidoreductase YuxK
MFFAVFSDTDRISIDEFRRNRKKNISELNNMLTSNKKHSMIVLKLILLVVGIFYFATGFAKLEPSLSWFTGDNLARGLRRAQLQTGQESLIGDILIQHDILSTLGAISTMFLELGFLIAILTNIMPLIIFIIGFFILHTLIALTITPNFFDQYIILMLFLPFDRIYSRVAFDQSLDVIYDENCHFCIRSLLIIKHLDINNTISYYAQSDIPESYSKEDLDYETAMYVYDGNNWHRGYYGFRRILRNFRIFAPIYYLMRFTIAEKIGEHVYRYIADNRSKHFACDVEGTE